VIVEITETDSIQHPCVYEDSNFSVYIENNTVGWTLHCLVNNWKVSVYKDMLKVFSLLIESAPRNELYAFSKNDKLTKFCSLFGMDIIDEMHSADGTFEGDILCLTL
jgi:Holliday junction resolvasome RuvABC DNA-binding subunit